MTEQVDDRPRRTRRHRQMQVRPCSQRRQGRLLAGQGCHHVQRWRRGRIAEAARGVHDLIVASWLAATEGHSVPIHPIIDHGVPHDDPILGHDVGKPINAAALESCTTMLGDLRICFLGDPFVAGTGDPEHLGWVGRLAARTHRAGHPLTTYNLGVRRQTSTEVRQRWLGECAPRLPDGCNGRVVISFGVNDTTLEDDRQRVLTATSIANLTELLTGARAAGWPVLVVGPPPVADLAQNRRTEHLDQRLGDAAGQLNVSYVSCFSALSRSSVWMGQIAAGDGAHPAGEGYAVLADLVWAPWGRWLPISAQQ